MQSLKGCVVLWIVGIALAFVIIVLSLGAFARGSRSPESFRYRITVEVETSQGPVSGSAVRQLSFSKTMNGGNLAHVTGEAVVLDLPRGQTLFALLVGTNGNADHASQAMWHLFRELDQDVIELWPELPQINNPRIPTPVPMLVTFGDIAEPTSVELVDPNNLAANFGPGVELKRVAVEKTIGPVTTQLSERLRWLSEHPEPRLDPEYLGSTNPNLSQRLWHGDFRRGTSK